jgi:hypothetical protein
MAIVTGRLWECDLCGWRWIYVEGKRPTQCPNRKCRTRKWDMKNFKELQAQMSPARRASIRVRVEKELVSLKPHHPRCICFVCKANAR